MKRFLTCLFIFVLPFSVPAQAQKIEKPDCDTSDFIISGTAAADTALEYIHNNDFQRVDTIKAVMENNSCVWKVTTRGVGTVHHGYYSTTYHCVFVDPMTGAVIKSTGWKVLGEKVR